MSQKYLAALFGLIFLSGGALASPIISNPETAPSRDRRNICGNPQNYTLRNTFQFALQHHSTVTGRPSGKVYQLQFHICERNGSEPAFNSLLEQRARDGAAQFVNALQTHFRTRTLDALGESNLTRCWNRGTTFRVPDIIGGTSLRPNSPEIATLPITGFQLRFERDPNIVLLFGSGTGFPSGGATTLVSFPADISPQRYPNILINKSLLGDPAHLAGIITHELFHHLGYRHTPNTLDRDAFIQHAGECVRHRNNPPRGAGSRRP